jgi:hypothetical protein
MKKTICLLLFSAFLGASSCGNSVPPPDAPDSVKADKCLKVSEDQALGCKACAGYAFCGWTRTTGPTSGTCSFVKDVKAPPPGVISDPTDCPAPE